MGAVYLAERTDRQYEQRVAIKLIKRGMDTDEVLRALPGGAPDPRRLDHPNIARLLDGGTTDDGLPYFVMEYIEGEPIDATASAHRLASRGSASSCSARSAPPSPTRTSTSWCTATSSRSTSS